MSTLIVGAAVDVHLVQSSWEIHLGAGVGRSLSTMKGAARPGYVSAEDIVWATSPFGRWSVHLDLGARCRAFAGVMVGATVPRVTIRLAERDAASWGQPFVIGTLGLEASALSWGAAR